MQGAGRMLEKADEVLKLALAAAALLVGVSVAYYYGIFLPEKARTEEQRLVEADKAKQEAAVKQAKKQETASRDAKVAYDKCLLSASQDYSSRWNKTCIRLNKEDVARKAQCAANGYYNCDQILVTPANGCSLPNELADDYDKSLDEEKKLCLEEFKAAS